MRTTAPALCMIGLLAGATLGCIDHEGQLAIYLTDDVTQVDGQVALPVQQINVEINEVAVREAGSTQFFTLAGGSRVFELIGLDGRVSLIALAAGLDQATYDAVRLTFSEGNSNVITDAGRKSPLSIEPTTITIPVGFQVIEDAQTDVTLMIDVDASVAQKANGAWVLRPIVRFSAPQ